MAEFVMKDLVKKMGLEPRFQIASAATSTEEIGNPVYPPARRKLAEHGISCGGKTARQLTREDYAAYDLLIGMDQANIRNIRLRRRSEGEDPPAAGVRQPSRPGGGRSLVHRRFRGHLAGCTGGVPRTSPAHGRG